jgi:hypothetical protein
VAEDNHRSQTGLLVATGGIKVGPADIAS